MRASVRENGFLRSSFSKIIFLLFLIVARDYNSTVTRILLDHFFQPGGGYSKEKVKSESIKSFKNEDSTTWHFNVYFSVLVTKIKCRLDNGEDVITYSRPLLRVYSMKCVVVYEDKVKGL